MDPLLGAVLWFLGCMALVAGIRWACYKWSALLGYR